MSKEKHGEQTHLTRLAVVLQDRCKPKLCQLECKRACPVNRQGKKCITVEKTSTHSAISETLCIGCGACQKKCPFDAIKIINLPTSLSKDVTHRYSDNGFKLHRLPLPRAGKVLGLIGTNGIGKSTALGILSGEIRANLGDPGAPATWQQILGRYRGSELHKYFTRLMNKELSVAYKTQYVDRVAREKGEEVVEKTLQGEKKEVEKYTAELELGLLLKRKMKELSGGELQRVVIAQTMLQKAEVYIFDEPSSYLDIRQRIKMANLVRGLSKANNYIIVVEHDLSIMDLMCDYGCVLYGEPGAYGVISLPFTVREAINIFLNGMLPTENIRFRKEQLTFRMHEQEDKQEPEMDKEENTLGSVAYPRMKKTWEKSGFVIDASPGEFAAPEIIVLLGENGMGKTSFIKMLSGETRADDEVDPPRMDVSIKPQKIVPKYGDTVRKLFLIKAKHALVDSLFTVEVLNPLGIDKLFDKKVKELSGGELQRVAIALCLSKPASIYLLDEPSAYLDSDQRIIVAKAIKRFITSQKKVAFVVEHDMIMATYIADRVIVFSGAPGAKCEAGPPCSLVSGLNRFLKELNVTFRKDAENHRPRINTPNSAKDREQKDSGNYFG